MASFVSLGATTVPVPGTPVRLALPMSLQPPTVHALLIEALPDNTDVVYIGVAGMDKSTLAGVIIVLPAPTVNIIPTFSASIAQAANGLPVGDLYVDAAQADEGVVASALVA